MSDALKKYGDLLAGDQKALANLGTVMAERGATGDARSGSTTTARSSG